MSHGKDRYEERRRLETENVILREQKENRRMKNDSEMEEAALIVIRGLRDLFDGKAILSIEPGNNGTMVRFMRG